MKFSPHRPLSFFRMHWDHEPQWNVRRRGSLLERASPLAPGFYWLCPYEVLERAGLQVVVVND